MKWCWRRAIVLGVLPLVSACQAGADPDVSSISVIAQQDRCDEEQQRLEVVSGESMPPGTPASIARSSRSAMAKGHSVLVVYLGQRPTPGYGAELAQASVDGGNLQIRLRPTEPEPGAMMAQMITTPCLGLRVPAEGWSQLEVAMDAEGFPLKVAAGDY